MVRSLKLFFFLVPLSAGAQQDYWQQEVHYTIAVSLNDQQHSLSGQLSVDYINHSPDTLSFIWFHLWPNAYKNDSTALAKQLASDSTQNKKKLEHRGRGYIDSLLFKVDGNIVKVEQDPANIDIARVILAKPLLPGQQVAISTPFHVQLPPYYSRSGYDGKEFMVCQWYPKPAVYDRKGWHPIPYLDAGEFYSEFGTYKVSVTVPSRYVVGASGTLLTTDELNIYKAVARKNEGNKGPFLYLPADPKGTKTLQYYGENIHDFAWFASPEYIIRHDTLHLASGKTVEVFTYSNRDGNKHWNKSTDYIKDAIRYYSGWIGEYPYPMAQAVEGPKNFSSGGMEYPMITLITSPDADEENLDAVIAHEVGHNWFYATLGTNEREYPWMDEGINTYFQFRYEAEKYKANSIFGNAIPKEIKKLPTSEFLARLYDVLNSLPAKQPVNTPATGFPNKEDYGIVVYVKTAIWLYIVETSIGWDNMEKGFHSYFNAWKFKHPYPEDLKAALEEAAGLKLDKLFDLSKKEGNFE